ncbi:uncharacterized protein MEPE_04461 [Melanopsichium pennsylvanicum]|uniref:Inositol polyphosphate-related phosphatase domain-containing protein n=2 Tax=Melanopsichium pennsylvanicum TaxID=63383 RepID=A0AAJ4XPY8_9BASI|nr:dnase i-like protein [Melanopsichium pennsylvanicum 4]SNX85752.1 uncharacterized protein MEPE_04461 [Melanopsichium pennsylvanicum]
MADQKSTQEPDEFGALSGAVSDLRSRFEQLSKSEGSRPTTKQALSSTHIRKKDLDATHNFGQAEKKLVMQPMASSSSTTLHQSNKSSSASTTSSVGGEAHVSSTTPPTTVPIQPSIAVPPTLNAADLATSPISKSTLGSSNGSTVDLMDTSSKDKQTTHLRQVSGSSKGLAMPASKFGKQTPSLVTLKPYTIPATSTPSASTTACASASDAEGSAKAIKIPPPRPPKPPYSSHGIQILDDADLERLSSLGSSSRVTSLASMFGHPSNQNKSKGTSTSNSASSSLAPSRIAVGSNHFLKYSRSNEQLSPIADGDSKVNPFKEGPPIVPPRPAIKTDSSLESFARLPGSIASVILDVETGSAPALPPKSAATETKSVTQSPQDAPLSSSSPPLLSRDLDSLAPGQVQRRRLSASRSTSALPLLDIALAGELETPPLPARRPIGNEAAVTQEGTSILPPPQRNAQSTSSLSSHHRANTVTARSRPIPASSFSARHPQHARSLSPWDIENASPVLPPPIRNVSIASNASNGRSFGSSFRSNRPGTDSSDEEDDVETPSSFSPSSSYKAPMGLRRAHPAADMTPGGLPDTSHANRRAPKFSPDCCTSAKSGFQCFAVCGNTVVTGSGDKVKVYRVGESASGVGEKLCTVGEHLSKEVKLTALEFRPPNHSVSPVPAIGRRSHGETADEGRYLWCGTKDGHIWELDIAEAAMVYSRQNVHSDPIQLLKRVGNKMLSLDEGGKISIWLPSSDPDPAIAGLRLSNQPITQRIAMEKGSFACIVGQQLWVAAGPSAQRHAKDYAGSKGPRIRVYNLFADDKPFNALSKAIAIPSDMAEGVGVVTGGAVIPSRPSYVYFGHDSGHISIWSRQTYECISVRRLGPHGLTAVAGVVKYLWVATRAGTISVFDTEAVPWRALKIWTAHKEPITAIKVDEHGIEKVGRLQVASGGMDAAVHLWDGTLSFDWIETEKGKREHEFCSYRSIKTLNVTFNMDAASPGDLNSSGQNMEVFSSMLRNACQVGSETLEKDRPPDIIVFGFQELIDLESKKLTAKSLLLGGKKRANDLGDRVSRQYRAWYDKLIQIVRYAMPPTCGYLLVQSESLVGLLTCVFVKQTEFKNVRELAISTVKTGMGGRYGNKGAVIARLVIQDSSLVFVNSHLAAGQKHVNQRNADVADILEYPSVFDDPHADPAAYIGGGDGSMILDHELCFFSGDLNYRIDHSRETVLSAISGRAIAPLLEQDQLRKELRHNPAFRLKDFSEAPISFLPTYKYDRGTHEWDTSDKNRIPAWCDRVLYKSHNPDRIRCLEYRRWECTISDHRPVTAVFESRVKAADHKARQAIEDQVKEEWRQLESKLLVTAVAFYSDPQ